MTAPRKAPTPPRHLGPEGRKFWKEIVTAYALDGPGERRLLLVAAEAVDRGALAREAIARDGLLVPGRFADRLHPAHAVARDAALVTMRALRALGVDAEGVA